MESFNEINIDSPKTPEGGLDLMTQFLEPHYFKLESGEELKYTIVKAREESERAEWVVIVGGFSSTKEMWEEEVLNLADAGKNVIFVTPDMGTNINDEEEKYLESEGQTIPSTIRKKAAAVKRLLDHLGIHTTNFVGQSQGAAIVATLAGIYPQLARKVLLDSPAGIATQKTRDFLKRAYKDAVGNNLTKIKVEGEVHPELVAKAGAQNKEFYKKVLRHPFWRAFREVPDIARVDIIPILKDIRKKRGEKGAGFPEIVLLNANKDTVMPKDKIEARLGFNEETGLPEDGTSPLDIVDNWLMYADKDMGHGKYQRPVPGMLPQIFSEDNHAAVIKHLLDVA